MTENAKSKRTVVKSALTRFSIHLTKVQEEGAAANLTELAERLQKARLLLDEFNAAQQLIEGADDDYEAHSVAHNEERNNFENNYFKSISSAQQLIDSANVQNSASNSFSASENTSSIPSISNVKLPSINLPEFNGSYDQWLFFRDTFTSIIHQNLSLSAVQKFHYLRLSLKGVAADVINSLEISDANYDVAWRLLKERFENKQLLANNHIKQLFELPTVHKDSHKSLRQLLDGLQKHLRALEVLKLPTKHWDALIIYLAVAKLDIGSKREWESSNSTVELPTLTNFITFLKNRCRFLESLEINAEGIKSLQVPFNFKLANKNSKAFIATSNLSCSFCHKEHAIYSCSDFFKLQPAKRLAEVKRLRLCINCLRPGHSLNDCRSGSCRKCEKSHHTLLHFQSTDTPAQSNSHIDSVSLASNNIMKAGPSQVLLTTAIVQIFDKTGNSHNCRALLDSGSQSNFISQSLCNSLQLQQSISFSVSGIGQTGMKISHRTTVKIHSLLNDFHIHLSCLVLPTINGNIPTLSINKRSLNIPQNLRLADPEFHESKPIDLLIGADIFWDLLCVGQVKLGVGQPILQKTKLGWVISGPLTANKTPSSKIQCNFNLNRDTVLEDQLLKFWQLEDPPMITHCSKEEIFCENHFKRNVSRHSDGRFIVSLPLKLPVSMLGDSYSNARKRFLSLERKLERNSTLKIQYHSFMEEYLNLHHMSMASDQTDHSGVFLPHHGVLKEKSSTTTKLRVVFDGSNKSSTGYSVNDLMAVGPTIQNDLFSILVRFRKHNIAITADVAKMYRQVWIHTVYRHLQKVLWRFKSTDDLSIYTLNTVTYGTASAAFLVIRALHEAAHLTSHLNPHASTVILRDFYVDDLLSGGDNYHEVNQLKASLISLLQNFGFDLRKWVSNDKRIQNSCHSGPMSIGADDQSKTLGILWDSVGDNFLYCVSPQVPTGPVTKRQILSSVAQIFDPLGLLAPVIITAKILLLHLHAEDTSSGTVGKPGRLG